MDASTRLAELGVRHGDLLFVQNSGDVLGPSGAPATRDAKEGVAALPGHLRRVLAEAGPVTCAHHALLLAAHAALLESGLEPAWPVQAFIVPDPLLSGTLERGLAGDDALPAHKHFFSG